MLYDFSTHIQELHDDLQKKENVLDKYTKYFGSLDGMDIHDTMFYKKYLAKFECTFLLATPEDLEGDYDKDLLVKLVVASCSSEYDLILDEKWKKNPIGMPKVHIYITVKHGEQTITKDIEELWSFQIIRLFEIYVEEQMCLFANFAEEKEEDKEEYFYLECVNDDEEPDEFEIKQVKILEEFKHKTELLAKEARNTRMRFEQL